VVSWHHRRVHQPTSREPIPLSERKLDWYFVGFFILNLSFITYIVDVEQIIIADPNDFEYPLWPPAPFVDLIHWWGHTYDPVLLARPAWWRATIWIDSLLFGPFYAAALYAFIKGKDWIRIPCFLWAGVMFANVTIICFEEMIGAHATPERGMVLLANTAWWLTPMLLTARMWTAGEHPFTRAASGAPTRA
jgi:hypothetical protein